MSKIGETLSPAQQTEIRKNLDSMATYGSEDFFLTWCVCDAIQSLTDEISRLRKTIEEIGRDGRKRGNQ